MGRRGPQAPGRVLRAGPGPRGMLRLCPKAAEFASRAPRGRPGEGGKARAARLVSAGAAPGPGPRQGHLAGPTRRPQHRHLVLCTPSGKTPRPRNRTANTRPGSLHPESVPPALLLRPVSPPAFPSVWGPSRRAQVLLRPAVPPKPPQHSKPAPQKPPQHTRHRSAPSAQQHLRLPLNAAASANSSRQEAPKGLLQTAQRRLRILLRRTEQTPSQTPHNKAAPPHPSARGRTSESFYTTKRSLKILLFLFLCVPHPHPHSVWKLPGPQGSSQRHGCSNPGSLTGCGRRKGTTSEPSLTPPISTSESCSTQNSSTSKASPNSIA